jgi:hypothetical protein
MTNQSRLALRVFGAAVGLTFSVAGAFAATQGTLDKTTSGSINITATVGALAQISGLSDVAFLVNDLSVPVVDKQNVCVYSNFSPTPATGGQFTITATGDGPGGEFSLNGPVSRIGYTVIFNNQPNQGAGIQLQPGAKQTFLTSGAFDATRSDGNEDASLVISIPAANFSRAQSGTPYNGVLTLDVLPQ